MGANVSQVDSAVIDRSVAGRLAVPVLEFSILAIIYAVFQLLQAAVTGSPSLAMANAHGVIQLERRLDIFHELQLQAWVLAHPAVRDLLRFSYCHLHLSVLIAFLLWVCFLHRDRIRETRSALILILGAAIPVYFLYPMAPPRFLPHLGFVDVVHMSAGVQLAHVATGFHNPFAAMPSLHCALALFVAIGIIRTGRNRIKWASLLYFGLIVAAVLGTANHFIVDATMGSLLAASAYVAANYWSMFGLESRRILGDLLDVASRHISEICHRHLASGRAPDSSLP